MIAKALLIMGGEVDEVKFPHVLIIPPMNTFSRPPFTVTNQTAILAIAKIPSKISRF